MKLSELTRRLQKFNKMKIQFVEPDRLHPSGDGQTIADVAIFLENKYDLCANFIQWARPRLIKQAARYILSDTHNDPFFLLENWLKDEWRDYIVDAVHGLTTQASQDRGSEPFIDTGAYYRSMIVLVK